MRKFIEAVKEIQRSFNNIDYKCINIEGKPFFGEAKFVFNDGKLVHFSDTYEDKGIIVVETSKLS